MVIRNYSKRDIRAALDYSGIITYPEYSEEELNIQKVVEILTKKDRNGYIYNDGNLKSMFIQLGFNYFGESELNTSDYEELIQFFKKNVSIDGEFYKNPPSSKDSLGDKVVAFFKPKHKAEAVQSESVVKYEMPRNITAAEKICNNLFVEGKVEKLSDDNFDISDDNIIFFSENLNGGSAVNITANDGIYFRYSGELETNAQQFFIITSEEIKNEIKAVAFGELVKIAERTYALKAERENIQMDFLSTNSNYLIMFADNSPNSLLHIGKIKIKLKRLDESENFLCVDFGTSNTAAGTYEGNTIKLVEFQDVTSNKYITENLCPTMVYVKAWTDSEKELLFGYDAKKVLIDEDYNPKGSFFFEIKHWIADGENESITIHDENGNEGSIRAGDLISSYLKYIVGMAEINFKKSFIKLHFSAPVKLKNHFLDYIKKEVFPDDKFSVMSVNDSLDEGVAIVYEKIASNLKEFEDNRKTEINSEIMIVDCGGGTTDSANCRYQLKNVDTGIKLNIATKFVNGNSQFGGNNITYRIFQLLKIKLALFYEGKATEENDTFTDYSMLISELIGNNGMDILNEIDNCVVNNLDIKIYQKLDQRSNEAERTLPTDFGYAKMKNEKERMRRNFNYLWQLAEQIKVKFNENDEWVRFDFYDDAQIRKINIKVENMYFYFRDRDGNFERVSEFPRIEINTKEIGTLLRPEIYYLLCNLFILPNKDVITNNVNLNIHLSGQSCNIALFRELLKEFIPGRNARPKTQKQQVKNNLKLDCVTGCIKYVRDRAYGAVIPHITSDTPNIIHNVYITRGSESTGKEVINGARFRSDEKNKYMPEIVIEQREPMDGVINLSVKSAVRDTVIQKYSEKICCQNGTLVSIDELCNRIQQDSLSELDRYIDPDSERNVLDRFKKKIEEIEADEKGKLLIFVIPNNYGYGFVLYQIFKCLGKESKYEYYLNAATPLNYESTKNIRTIFDGKNCRTEE